MISRLALAALALTLLAPVAAAVTTHPMAVAIARSPMKVKFLSLGAILIGHLVSYRNQKAKAAAA